MELDVRVGKEALSIIFENPFRLETDAIVEKIQKFIMRDFIGFRF